MHKRLSVLSLSALALFVLPLGAAEDPAEKTSPQRSPEALEILEKADAAIKKIKGIRFAATVKPEGGATQFVSYAEGHGHMTGYNGQVPEKFWGKVETTRLGTDEKIVIEGGGDGDTYYLVDHSTKKGYEDMDPGVMGDQGQLLQNIGMIEYVHPNPFDDELEAEVVELAGEEEIGGEPTQKVRVVYAGGRGESIWAFSKKDHLPRQRVRVFNMPGGTGTVTITMKELEVEPKVDAGDYKMSLPEGYEQIDDFAP